MILSIVVPIIVLCMTFIVSYLYFNKTMRIDIHFIGSKEENSDDLIEDAMKYFEIKNYGEFLNDRSK